MTTTVKCEDDGCVHNAKGVCGCAEIVIVIRGDGEIDCTTWEAPLDDPVKDDCVQKNIQGCFECKDVSCGDNTNPAVISMAGCPHDVVCSVCHTKSTSTRRHVYYKERGVIKCSDCLVTEDDAKTKGVSNE